MLLWSVFGVSGKVAEVLDIFPSFLGALWCGLFLFIWATSLGPQPSIFFVFFVCFSLLSFLCFKMEKKPVFPPKKGICVYFFVSLFVSL